MKDAPRDVALTRKRRIVLLGLLIVVAALAPGVWHLAALKCDEPQRTSGSSEPADQQSPFKFASQSSRAAPRMMQFGKLTLHWDSLPNSIEPPVSEESASNIHPEDYVGPDACKKCHKKNYDNWARHPHRFMNARADEETVKGDFSGNAGIVYQGAEGKFYQESGGYRMKIQRGGVTHVYDIAKTLGSRFFQYYIGRGIEGPPPVGHNYYEEEQVLPFGYWIDRKMWVPIVHVAEELPDEGGRWNPLDPPFDLDSEEADLVYANRCSVCHTTYPLGDSLVRHPEFRSETLPFKTSLSVSRYTAKSHPELWDGKRDSRSLSDSKMFELIGRYSEFQTPDQAATLGISCEACHLGARAHAEGRLKKPAFSMQSSCLTELSESAPPGPVQENVNWACSRCHTGKRPQYASGVSTWNSVEYSDAMRGGCYSQLKCVDCHEPHTATGRKWSKPPAADDAVCMRCHEEYKQAEVRQQHTHHTPGTAGDRCLNCHMPRINEGLQDAVRTHMIYSPTRADMIEAGQPNACNMCHLKEPINWTLSHLQDWYDASFDDAKVAAAYADPTAPVGIHWLQHKHESTRLAAVEALAKQDSRWALREMIEILDDPYLLNRQFAQKGLEEMLQVRMDRWGYVFYMTKKERAGPLVELRKALLPESEPAPAIGAAQP